MNERRIAGVWVLVLLVELIAIAIQVPARHREGSLLAELALRTVGPVARGVAATGESVGGGGNWFRSRRSLEAEKRELTARVDRLETELLRLRTVEDDLDALARTLDYIPPSLGELQPASVVYLDRVSRQGVLIVYCGTCRPRRDQPVVVAEGLVGRVVAVAGGYARVQLITDASSGIGAMVERTRRQGVVKGAEAGAMELAYLPVQAEIGIGNLVATSGTDGVYPRGIPIGHVAQVLPGDDLFHEVRLTPTVDFGSLTLVYLLKGTGIPSELTEDLPSAGR